jgi:hypothetical protein
MGNPYNISAGYWRQITGVRRRVKMLFEDYENLQEWVSTTASTATTSFVSINVTTTAATSPFTYKLYYV